MFTRHKGKLLATPLLAVLIVIETSDVVFAVDSIPAILAVSHEQFIVFSSNAFAILGLRALYFLLADLRDKFSLLQEGLAVILAFVGVKMIVAEWYHIPTALSLGVIALVRASPSWLSIRKDARARSRPADPVRAGRRRCRRRRPARGVQRDGAARDGAGGTAGSDDVRATGRARP